MRDERQGGKTLEDRIKFGSDPIVDADGQRMESGDEQTKAEDVSPPPKSKAKAKKDE